MVKAHLGTTIDEALNAQKLQGKVPSDFLSATAKAVDSDKLDGLDSSQFLRKDITQTMTGALTIDANASGALTLKAGTSADHVYLQLYADSQAQSTRSGYIGYGSSGSNVLAINNEMGGNIQLIGTAKLLFNTNEILNAGNLGLFLATQSAHGVFSNTDKTKLDNIQANAINTTTGDGRYVNLNLGDQTIIGGKLIIDNVNYNTHLRLKRTSASMDYGLDIAPSTDGYVNFLPLSGTTGYKFTGMVVATGNIQSDTQTYNGVNIVTLNTNVTNHIGSGGTSHALTTTTAHGFMDFNDKVKLNGIQTSAINQTTADGRYLQLTGGTISGALNTASVYVTGTLEYGSSASKGRLSYGTTGLITLEAVTTNTTIELKPTGTGKANVNGNEIFTNANKGSYLVTTTAHGFMDFNDKVKLNGIATGAEVNQNAFSYVAVSGNATINANAKMSTLTFIAGAGVNITTDTTGMTVTMESSLADGFIGKTGGQMEGVLSFTTGSTSTLTSYPTALSHGKLQSYTSLMILADTDNSLTGEHVLIASGRGLTPTSAQGLKIGYDTLTWMDNTVWHNGNFNPNTKLNTTGGTITGNTTITGVTTAEGHLLIGDVSNNKYYFKGVGNQLWLIAPSGQVPTLLFGDAYDYDRQVGVKYTVGTVGGNASVLEIGQLNKNNANYTHGETRILTGGVSRLTLTNTLATLSTPLRGGSTGGSLRISTTSGYVDIGAQNTAHAHFYTDRASYYFDKDIRVGSGKLIAHTGDLQLATTTATRIYVKDSNGYVGIGNTAPAEMLHVSGNTQIDGKQAIIRNAGNEPAYSNGHLELRSTDGSDIVLGFHRSGYTATSIIHTGDRNGSGQLAITNTTPTERGVLEVKATEFRTTSTSNAFKIEFNATENSLDFVFI